MYKAIETNKMKIEDSLQIAVCSYIRLQYPKVIFTSESSGVKLTMGQAVKAKKMRSSDKLPDIWIPFPMFPFFGLFIELKAEYPYNKKGKPKTPHIAAQLKVLERLSNMGYMTAMLYSFDSVKELIDRYMNLPEWEHK